jgi:hypothetical protein
VETMTQDIELRITIDFELNGLAQTRTCVRHCNGALETDSGL